MEPLTGPALRASLEEAAQIALDAADRIIAVLDHMDGDPDLEDSADDEPSLAAPGNQGSQVTWLRGTDQDCEAGAPEIAIPETRIEAPPATASALAANLSAISIEPVRWGGRGNVVSLAGVAVLDLSAAAGDALLALAKRR
ncbi:hypothetical protein [Methylobacterium sp. J-026]|uniref:hypothetical protein n=1 Tax=Methylobacterium sp. J-026 TaxID=2836624 RepID=UPI001FB9BC05|nr:hypothetical protein [Methylobacterium sp. J-026]